MKPARRPCGGVSMPGLRQIAFFVVPSSVAFLALGDVIAGAVLQTGRFTHADALYVWAILAGSSVGLVASTLGRLYSSTFYALRDTRTPLRFALVRVSLTTVLGYLFALPLAAAARHRRTVGSGGLTASAGLAGWIEMLLLRHAHESADRIHRHADDVPGDAVGCGDCAAPRWDGWSS